MSLRSVAVRFGPGAVPLPPRALWLALLLGIGALGTVRPALAQRCTVTLKADGNTAAVQRALEQPGRRKPVVCVKPGIYGGARLIATRDAILRKVGKGRAVFDAGARGRVITVMEKGIKVELQGLVLTNGDIEEGGAVALLADSTLRLEDCWLTANRASRSGGALYAQAGRLELVRTRVTSNYGAHGGAIALEGTAVARGEHLLVSDNKNDAGSNAPIWLDGGVRLELMHSTLAYNTGHGVYLRPQPRGPWPTLLVDSSIVMGGPDAIFVSRSRAVDVAVFRSVVHGRTGFIALDLETVQAVPRFNLTEEERYRPAKGSAAVARGQCKARYARTDLVGHKRSAACTAGALEALPKDVAATLAARKKKPAPDDVDWW